MTEKTDSPNNRVGAPAPDTITNEDAKQAVEGGSGTKGANDAEQVEKAVSDLDNGLPVTSAQSRPAHPTSPQPASGRRTN